MTSVELRELVRVHYGPQGHGWAVFDEVRNETGYTSGVSTRTCDVLALSLWRSKGIELHGLELKVSRGDWLRELRQPAKATAIAKFVDFWWLVVPSAKMVAPGELPMGWGLMVVDEERAAAGVTKPLRVAHKAPHRQAQPLDRLFIAAVMRKLARGEFINAPAPASPPPPEVGAAKLVTEAIEGGFASVEDFT